QAAVRKATGQDYGWFFDQWINRGGVPVLKLANVEKKQTADGFEVTGEIQQEGAPYRLDVPLTLELESGDPVRTVAELRGSSVTFRLASKTAPRRLLLDPRSEEHTSELQSQSNLVCRLLLEKKNK